MSNRQYGVDLADSRIMGPAAALQLPSAAVGLVGGDEDESVRRNVPSTQPDVTVERRTMKDAMRIPLRHSQTARVTVTARNLNVTCEFVLPTCAFCIGNEYKSSVCN
ncbi:dolichyl-phosphate-mannose-protein mannosyltransferase [Pseudozyma hubeiensis SY62]|uniref:Dolichyl-phosphate-mannose-protein mannosyltransferase n=1 Tax=Pseudozyma hubeiensis (strain SY62) TaxID=1305764 RepID=R9NW97_PSEHS|nr:dolichyl-phosphate-mannose-protein mannosyltransferase [Pseudozyma hubeiensis SY62]GAC92756.1 dolichyl-phosphate-mannose-protein mannosyltransferase [Pseudozyma hubeiensis SY62]